MIVEQTHINVYRMDTKKVEQILNIFGDLNIDPRKVFEIHVVEGLCEIVTKEYIA